MIDWINRLKAIVRRMPIIDDIYDLINAMLTLQETGGSLTADGTEQNVYLNNLPLGSFDPRLLNINLDNMAAGDRIIIREYYRTVAAGAWVQFDEDTFADADGGLEDDSTGLDILLKPNRHGVRVTLEQDLGTYRAYPWDVLTEQ